MFDEVRNYINLIKKARAKNAREEKLSSDMGVCAACTQLTGGIRGSVPKFNFGGMGSREDMSFEGYKRSGAHE